MRIAILGSVATQIPPIGQAAIETLVNYQALGLAAKNHQILLFAPVGSSVSHPNIQLVPVGRGGTLSGQGKESEEGELEIGSSYKLRLEIAHLSILLQKLIDLKDEYDVILNNLRGEAVIFPVAKLLNKKVFHVMHMPLFDEIASVIKKYQTSLIAISIAQRKAYPDLNYAATVYNGVDPDLFSFNPKHLDYFLYLGSITPNKNPAAAVRVCRSLGVSLKIGGRIKDEKYYKKEIEPFVDGTQIQWIGEITQEEIIKMYQGAKAFLFPTLWEEPFGLVLIEAMSCGTPVIAYANGAIPEVVVNGRTGFVIEDNSEEKMMEKMKIIDSINRKNCREHVEKNFTIEKMVEGYNRALAGISQ
ncbi:hypothetical protein A3D77_03335 [Candidatus Gottesmanbacteria bacterium RIFCSPHIGHO2_02_FULL_39_11]|uniref:Glycosyl transferase family 1 domain-containing protein n=1 Tax=Candidatus Gottesmanbacteria bacterium RIFCSPHIGHO2_02_FULL_39_11 TaxID=1798382 RepID=A0A1F5ZPG2_9BACT|nr:MAG: hypothetical protein A3D77_03335 [Candidatus Gottesmanbacteria bacterium RIFCSPHIGHO2_02_FULL_39_11]